MTFTVFGTPAPQGSTRHVGNGVMIESSKKVKPWREAVKFAALESNFSNGFDGPVRCDITFTLARPAAAKKRLYPATKPDLDKLIRSTFDALSDVGLWEDDSRVVSVCARKVYVGGVGALHTAGAVITVQPA